ncbi:hypothetical protein IJ707_04300 [bacterium]|nr:hypothetical protein [bacterium]
MISTITSGMMLNMYKYGSPTKQIDQRQVFASVSIMVGGDGRSISKSQLKSFIDKASNGSVRVSDTQLRALKSMYSSWNDLFGKDTDAITVDDFNKAPYLFYQVAMSSNEEDENEKFAREMREKAEKYRKELSEKINGDDSKTPTLEQLQEYLNELISKNDEENNDDEIAKVTNIIENIKNIQNEYEA